MGDITFQVLSLMVLIGIGYIIKKYEIISEDTVKDLSNLTVTVFLPALIIISMNRKFEVEKLKNSGYLILIGLIYYFTVYTFHKFISKKVYNENKKQNIYTFLGTFANVGYMGYPVIYSVFGKLGVFYAAVYNLSHGIFLWSIGVSLVSEKNEFKFKNLFNPGMIALVTGFLLFLFSVELPFILNRPLNLLGNVATPISMLIIGAVIAEIDIKKMMEWKLLILAIFKLLLIPITLITILYFLDISSKIKWVMVLISAMPCAVNSVVLSKKYSGDYVLASKGMLITTVLSMGTLPFLIYIMNKVNF
ncbi:MAG: AEC family transporter [Fusobacteriota bacterium]